MSFWYIYSELWTDFTHFSGVSIVQFEQANASWVICDNCCAKALSFILLRMNIKTHIGEKTLNMLSIFIIEHLLEEWLSNSMNLNFE